MNNLRAGMLTAGYENGFLRRISYGETEVLRMIYFALRDHNWNTIPSHIENENISIEEDSFEISYDCFNTEGGLTIMAWKAMIKGGADGTVTFELQGRMMEDFRKNRAGFCILHPLNISGGSCKIIHPDRTESMHTFPVEVSPDNPFKSIQSMVWRAAGIPFKLAFEGDVFETEDQRNWSDASYKTFCTPLDQPRPVLLKKGDKIFQRVTFKPGEKLEKASRRSPFTTLSDDAPVSTLPFMGVAASTEHDSLSDESVMLLRSLNLRHYRVDLYPAGENWVTQFSHSYEIGFSLRLALEVVLHLTDNFREEVESFIILCKQNKVKLRKILLLSNALVTGQKIIDEIPVLKSAFPNVAVGAGTNYNFNEINTRRFNAAPADFISFSIDPQEHAFDDITILENMETQEHLVRSAKSIYGERMSVHISPLTLRKRFNPYASNPEDLFIHESLKADPRQKKPFTAAWTFGSMCSLSKGGAESVTLFQTSGNQGILSEHGDPYPVFQVLKSLSPYQGKSVKILSSSNPHSVQGILLDGKVLALANFTPDLQSAKMGNRDYELQPLQVRFEALDRA
jgi:D-apionolactonase